MPHLLAVLHLLPEFLPIGAMCRLRRISTTAHSCIMNDPQLWSSYLGSLQYKSRRMLPQCLIDRVANGQRCRECGNKRPRPPHSICIECAGDPGGYYSMLDRKHVDAMIRADAAYQNGWRISKRVVLTRIRCVRRGAPYGKRLYWRHEVRQLICTLVRPQI